MIFFQLLWVFTKNLTQFVKVSTEVLTGISLVASSEIYQDDAQNLEQRQDIEGGTMDKPKTGKHRQQTPLYFKVTHSRTSLGPSSSVTSFLDFKY